MENKIFIKKETMKGIADAIRAKDGTTEEIAVTDMAERIKSISDNLELARQVYMINLFSLNALGMAEVTLNLDKATSLQNLCSVKSSEDNNITVEHLTINCPNSVTHIGNMLNGNKDEKLKRLTLNVDFSSVVNASYAFYGNRALEEIDGTPLDFTNVTSNTYLGNLFHLNYALKEVRFKGNINVSISLSHGNSISKESVESLFMCLSDEATGKSATFKKLRIDSLYETSSGAADGSTSTEWAELIATKPNWTISLV